MIDFYKILYFHLFMQHYPIVSRLCSGNTKTIFRKRINHFQNYSMNFNSKHFGLLGLVFLLIFSACRKDPDPVVIDPPVNMTEWEPRVENVTASVQGLVVDQNNEAVIDATVTLNGNPTTIFLKYRNELKRRVPDYRKRRLLQR